MDIQLAGRFLHRLHSAVNAHDADGIAALCVDDVLWDDPAAPGPLHGRAAVRSFHRDVMFRAIPDVQVELVDGPYLAGDGTGVAARLRIQGTMTGPLDPPGFAPIDGPIEFETAEFSTLRDGLLSRQVVVLNMLDLARQIRAIPKAGGLGDRIGIWAQHVAALRARSKP